MTEYRIMHVVESMSAGVAHSIKTIVSGYCNDIPAYIVHGQREYIEGQFIVGGKSSLIAWSAVREISPVKDFKALIQLIKIIRKVQPTLIHAHSTKAGVLGRIAAFVTGTPCLYTPHSYSFLRTDVSPSTRALYLLIERILAPFAATVACGLEEYYYARKMSSRSTIVENGVNVEEFAVDLSKVRGAPSVIAVGRITAQKDFPFFLKTAELLPEVQFKWVTGEDELPNVHLANVTMIGRFTPKQVSEALRNSTLFINTSKWEGLSRAIIEAASCGLPLVLRNAPGNREIAFRLPEAFLFDTPERAASQISDILDRLQKDESIGLDNRSGALQFYNSSKTQSRFRSIYDGIYYAKTFKA